MAIVRQDECIKSSLGPLAWDKSTVNGAQEEMLMWAMVELAECGPGSLCFFLVYKETTLATVRAEAGAWKI